MQTGPDTDSMFPAFDALRHAWFHHAKFACEQIAPFVQLREMIAGMLKFSLRWSRVPGLTVQDSALPTVARLSQHASHQWGVTGRERISEGGGVSRVSRAARRSQAPNRL